MKTKRAKQLVSEIRKSTRNAVPFDLTFAPCGNMRDEERTKLQEALKEKFMIWANTWIFPQLSELEEIVDGPSRDRAARKDALDSIGVREVRGAMGGRYYE